MLSYMQAIHTRASNSRGLGYPATQSDARIPLCCTPRRNWRPPSRKKKPDASVNRFAILKYLLCCFNDVQTHRGEIARHIALRDARVCSLGASRADEVTTVLATVRTGLPPVFAVPRRTIRCNCRAAFFAADKPVDMLSVTPSARRLAILERLRW